VSPSQRTTEPGRAPRPGSAPSSHGRPGGDRGRAALAGVLAVAVALGVAELVAGLLPGSRSLVLAVGDAVIDSVPGWLERAAIAALGTADKPVLVATILVLCAAIGAGLGLLGRRRFALAVAGLALLTAVGVVAAWTDPRGGVLAPLLVGLVGAAAGAGALRLLLRAGTAAGGPTGEAEASSTSGPDRRRFLGLASAAAAVGAVAAVGGRLLVSRDQVQRIRQAVRIPPPAVPAPPVPDEADLEIAGLTPLFIANEDFFRIDTALTVPQVDPAEWSLRITGMVDEPFELTYAELLEMPQIEADITLTCVSNEVGGELVGNARWQGVPLHVLLERAGLQEGATQLVGRSVDGFTAGFPTLTALDVRESMVAVAMNGEPLPAEHGFPARLVVPGLYGYVSATKWLSEIQLTGWDDVEGYWIPRGWAKEGPIKTQSRIDVPRPSSTVTAGRTPIAGVAWAPTRGIERVEVRVDDGPWVPAELAERLDVDCWRQWVLPWDATPGEHVIAVRATDGAGEVQTDERTPVAPDGASGRHTVRVFVEG
jgi:DMSO/TMAO reductase YedYZ molybdopterin-dependent catalytic subunit